MGLTWLSVSEHKLSIRPSDMATLYLLASSCYNSLDVLFAASTAVSWSFSGITWLPVSELAARLALLVLESLQKTGSMGHDGVSGMAPEETVGLLNATFFWWINRIILKGSHRMLRLDDIPPLDAALKPETLRAAVLRAWDRRDKPENKMTLPKVLVRSLLKPFLSVIAPRLFATAFRCSQPLLICETIRFISQTQVESGANCAKYWLVLAAVLVYVGLAISSAIHRHRLNRLEVMVRASLAALIYNKATELDSKASNAGRAVTLMSTDVDGIVDAGEMFHETWMQLVELTVGVIILASQVKWLSPLPFAIMFACSRVSRYLAQNIRPRQKAWNMATQDRMSALSSVLSSMKGLKSLGLTDRMIEHVRSLREREIQASKQVRWMRVVYNSSANALGIFAPVLTIVLYAIIAEAQGGRLDEETAFTTMATLSIVTHPANMIMTIIPQAVASMASFERIQEYLLEEPFADQRRVIKSPAVDDRATDEEQGVGLTNVTIHKPGSAIPILDDVSLAMKKGTLTICSGPVGSGKTALARAILGELRPASGEITLCSERIGYCDQNPWLPPGTIKQIICSFAEDVDDRRYQEVVSACCLAQDLASLPQRGETSFGNQGINLSGGQRQRLALARLLYSRPELAILDDPFTALDGTTETHIVETLLATNGWFRKQGTTVLLVTNSAQHYHLADQIALLDEGQIKSIGSWQDFQGQLTEIRKFTFDGNDTEKAHVVHGESPQEQAKALRNRDAQQDLHRKTGDFSLYAPTYWLKWWTGSERGQLPYYASSYVLLAVVAWAATSGTMWAMSMQLAILSGRIMHQSLLTAVLGAPLSYFSSTEIGVTINRFSQDITLVDRHLPYSFMTLCNQVFKLATQILVLLKRYYLRTSRQLRVMELESQAALFSSFLETVSGLVSIRAFGWQSLFQARNSQSLDESLRPLYLLFCLQRWLRLVLDLIMSTIAVSIIGLAARRSGAMSSADAGVALNLILVANSTLISLVHSWAGLEMSLGAVARIRETDLHAPREDMPGEDMVPDAAWPRKGDISLNNVTAYHGSDHAVVRGVNLHIHSGQKVVICGRTGSGKSTLLMALLRLTGYTGSIAVDGLDISLIPRSVLRQRCFITIPQDPFMIPEASLAFNLDPSSLANEEVLRRALVKVCLWQHLSADSGDSEIDPLDNKLSALPALSVGQLQLLAMARAIVQKEGPRAGGFFVDIEGMHGAKPIVLLDEATSSLDPATEAAIYDLIESEFVEAGHTVIIVAHRMSALSGRVRPGKDVVVFLDSGHVAQVGSYDDLAEYITAMEEVSRR
ncbi:ABC multidrug transporter [Purpureocillium lilacinum]|uniref:ABC multidrug transporter n=1 Tax=Purpureocillium lilacinum TaxID=33203 RepID=A0A179HG33_PURLI|nr:ABC multidrug transporter [Purpureocillium lilacinum]OAQ88974.1 ABC multidrug transporter [Purpureocillium lilacinum]